MYLARNCIVGKRAAFGNHGLANVMEWSAIRACPHGNLRLFPLCGRALGLATIGHTCGGSLRSSLRSRRLDEDSAWREFDSLLGEGLLNTGEGLTPDQELFSGHRHKRCE